MSDHGEHSHGIGPTSPGAWREGESPRIAGHGGDASSSDLAVRVERLEARLRHLEIWAVRVYENLKHIDVPDPLGPVADTVIGGAHPPRPPRLDALIMELIDLLQHAGPGRPDDPPKPRGEL